MQYLENLEYAHAYVMCIAHKLVKDNLTNKKKIIYIFLYS